MTDNPVGFTRTDDVPAAFDERTVLTTMLDYARDTVHVKCAGLSEEDAHRAPLPGSPLMTIAAVVSHLRWVEYYWFDVVLLAKSDQAPWTDDARERLKAMAETNDGFVIAERDLELRGPGDFFGTRQSGLPRLRTGDLVRDRDIMEDAHREARHLVDTDGLSADLMTFVQKEWQEQFGLIEVG